MEKDKVIIALPTNDLEAAYQFYRDISFRVARETEGDEMPEPVEFVITGAANLMVIPSGGFGWVAGGNGVAPRGVSECILSLSAESESQVDAFVERVRAAGGEIASEPKPESWGYSATFKDFDAHVWMVVASTR